MTNITRRAALKHVAVAGAIGGTMSVAAVSAATPDDPIFALIEEHDRVFAEMKAARDRWLAAIDKKLPPHLRGARDVSSPDFQEVVRAMIEIIQKPKIKALDIERGKLVERRCEIKAQVLQTEVTTFRAANAKLCFVMRAS